MATSPRGTPRGDEPGRVPALGVALGFDRGGELLEVLPRARDLTAGARTGRPHAPSATRSKRRRSLDGLGTQGTGGREHVQQVPCLLDLVGAPEAGGHASVALGEEALDRGARHDHAGESRSKRLGP